MSTACNVDTHQYKETIARLQNIRALQNQNNTQKNPAEQLGTDDEYKVLHDKLPIIVMLQLNCFRKWYVRIRLPKA